MKTKYAKLKKILNLKVSKDKALEMLCDSFLRHINRIKVENDIININIDPIPAELKKAIYDVGDRNGYARGYRACENKYESQIQETVDQTTDDLCEEQNDVKK